MSLLRSIARVVQGPPGVYIEMGAERFVRVRVSVIERRIDEVPDISPGDARVLARLLLAAADHEESRR